MKLELNESLGEYELPNIDHQSWILEDESSKKQQMKPAFQLPNPASTVEKLDSTTGLREKIVSRKLLTE